MLVNFQLPGMMLFQTEDQDIIYTGDFRASQNSIKSIKCLQNLKNVVAYIDSTFFKKAYMNFPSQKESVDTIVSEIRNHLSTSSHSKGNLLFN